MKKQDSIVLVCVMLGFLPFFLSDTLFTAYDSFNTHHGIIMSFLKFAVLATLGEVIGLRIKTGHYNQPGFGILPRAVVWGVLGLTIKFAFVVFANGVPIFLRYLGIESAVQAMQGGFSLTKFLTAFAISVSMNLIYAPIMMTTHKITDTHIMKTGGTLQGLFTPIAFGEHLINLNWTVQWHFVFKKTLPFFWIPAHTITFLLPAKYQVLFAALLGIALGVILAIASLKGKEPSPQH